MQCLQQISSLKSTGSELASHPDIMEVSVVARNHIKWGERPHAFVILKSQAISKWEGRHDVFSDELKAHAKVRLPGFACPEWVQIVKELPVLRQLQLTSFSLSLTWRRKHLQEKFSKQIYGRLSQNCSADNSPRYSNICIREYLCCRSCQQMVRLLTQTFMNPGLSLRNVTVQCRRRRGNHTKQIHESVDGIC